MTAPSNANTSGLEVVAWAVFWRHGVTTHPTYEDALAASGRTTQEPVALVTASSAAADVNAAHAAGRFLIDAAEARADRLEKALERIAYTPSGMAGLSLSDCISEARAALQQETQP